MAQKRRNIVILGSTGSIGVNTLKVVERYPERFRVIGLTAYNNVPLLREQIQRFRPRHVGLSQPGARLLKQELLGRRLVIHDVESGLEEIAALPAADIVVIAMSGSAALGPFLSAVRAGKTVAPANKEALVIAGELIMREARRHQATVIPVDSEQSAIFQCLNGQDRRELSKIYLTASGGALRDVPRSRFSRLTVKDILRHPRWRMGRKITVDSATLMNKGFEVIEAQRLFDLRMEEIEVVIHPEAIIHSMVCFRDGSVLAQLGITDMRLPIQYALTYPARLDSGLPALDLFAVRQLNFERPDLRKFPALALALQVAREGGTLPSVLNAADEEAVTAFLNGTIPFTKIYDLVEQVVARHVVKPRPNLRSILQADAWARQEVRGRLAKARPVSRI